MIRPERFDKIFYVGLPNKSERTAIMNLYNPGLFTQGVSLDFLTKITPNCSGAILKQISNSIN